MASAEMREEPSQTHASTPGEHSPPQAPLGLGASFSDRLTPAVEHAPSPNGHQNIALPWYAAGCSVVPITPYEPGRPDKKPATDWKNLQQERMSPLAVQAWWEDDHFGVAVICGAVSGGLEMTELEAVASSVAALDRLMPELERRDVRDLWDSLNKDGYAEWTPSGGLHLLYRADGWTVPGNTKLATRPVTLAPGGMGVRTLAETRGEGGYVVVAPTSGRCHRSGENWVTVAGEPSTIPHITWGQRQALHAAITAAFDESPPLPEPRPSAPRPSTSVQGLRPGDDFNIRASWEDDWFTGQGWTISHKGPGGETFWVRPGKHRRDGHSASTGHAGDMDRLYVWSSSTSLPIEEPLQKFFVYAHYHHGGDMVAAARDLGGKGFGEPLAGAGEVGTWDPVPRELGTEPAAARDLTDTGNGQRMRDMVGDRFLYNTVEKRWYVWSGTVWEPDDLLEVRRAAERVTDDMIVNATQMEGEDAPPGVVRALRKHAMTSRSEAKINAMVSRFAAQPGIAVIPSQFDQDPDLLNLRNGVYDLTTGVLVPHNPRFRLTQVFSASLDKDATCPRFRRWMMDAIPDPDTRAYVQRALGYSLLGDTGERVMFLLHGPTGTGKSVLTSLMRDLFGGYGQTAPASTFRLTRNETTVDLHNLRGSRYVTTSEMPEGQALDEELLKRLTGDGDEVTSRGHYERFQGWRPRCTIWIATNFLPKVTSDDNAVWHRAKTIHMATDFITGGRAVKGYARVLLEEADGILGWLLEGLAQYRERGLDEPASVTRDVERFRVDTDTVASFVADLVDQGRLARVAPDPDGERFVSSAELSGLYLVWCAEERATPFGRRRWANRLRTLGYVPGKVGGRAVWFGLCRKGV
jgi:putative DNA primase/helicase